MATLRPFRALRPQPADAARVAAVPYDVVNTEEARALAAGNPLSFLHVSRAEIDLPPGIDPHADLVYERAVDNFDRLKPSFIIETEPSLYVYRLREEGHEQTGLGACFALDDYDRGIIKKHERTRRDKEDDRTRHMLALGAQTGPVFLMYRAMAEVDRLIAAATTGEPIFDFEAPDGVRHTQWRIGGADRDRLVKAVAGMPALYIADGHHRAASAARARADIRDRGLTRSSLGDGADHTTFLGVAFPDSQVQILAYNRVVKDLAGLSPSAFLNAVRERIEIEAGPARPRHQGEFSMYVEGAWHTLRPRVRPDESNAIDSLDVSVLQDQLLTPVLKVGDIRIDKRIDFVGGARGTDELERLVQSGQAAVAFSMYPVRPGDLMAVSDAGAIMPPKSTWFEPKLRDGLLIHLI